MGIQETLIWGIVSGVVTSALLSILVQFFNKVILPWYRTYVYEGLIIEGAWESTNEHPGATDLVKIIINQSAHSLSGSMTVIKKFKKLDETEIKTFELTGYFRDGHIVLHGKNKNRILRGHIVYLLQVSKGGNVLSGQASWVDSNADSIQSASVSLKRCASA